MRGESEWVLVGLDERMARQQGLPACLPMPRGALAELAGASLDLEHARAWIKAFLASGELDRSGPLREKGAAIVADLEAFLDKGPLWDEARRAFTEGAYDRASDALKHIVTIDPEDHAARLNLASAQANLGDHASALKALQVIKRTFDGDADYHVAVGHVLMALDQPEPAVEQFLLALGAAADCQPALDALVELGLFSAIEAVAGDPASLTYVRADKLVDYVTGQWDAEPRRIEFYLEQLERHASERHYILVLAAAERALRLVDAAPLAASALRDGRLPWAVAEAYAGLGRTSEARAAFLAMDSDASLPVDVRERARSAARSLG
jgi:tetratricopeptide (TPR) repeat protein